MTSSPLSRSPWMPSSSKSPRFSRHLPHRTHTHAEQKRGKVASTHGYGHAAAEHACPELHDAHRHHTTPFSACVGRTRRTEKDQWQWERQQQKMTHTHTHTQSSKMRVQGRGWTPTVCVMCMECREKKNIFFQTRRNKKKTVPWDSRLGSGGLKSRIQDPTFTGKRTVLHQSLADETNCSFYGSPS